jgi:hypothetical protein
MLLIAPSHIHGGMETPGIGDNTAKRPQQHRYFFCRFRNLTPGPPPFSSMNSTPALSKAK